MYQLIKVANYIMHCIYIIDVVIVLYQVHLVWHVHSQLMLLVILYLHSRQPLSTAPRAQHVVLSICIFFIHILVILCSPVNTQFGVYWGFIKNINWVPRRGSPIQYHDC